jgi:hypothetical protein
MCASSGLTFLPEKKEISLNSMFIIEGYAYSQKTINSFKNRNVFLESTDGEKVELILQQILKGQMSLTQAIFKTKKELKPNTKYFLKFSNLTKNEKSEMYQWNSKTNKSEQVYWQTTNLKEINLLNSDLKINFEKTKVIHYGCGPSANAIFEILNKSENEIWYRTEVIDLTTKLKRVYIIREWNNNLNVGHGMCAGAFTFKRKGSYKVRFTPINTDGKMNKTTKWITFDNPYNNQKGFGF